MATPSSPPAVGKRYLITSAGSTSLISPSGCSGDGSDSFVGGGFSNSASGFAAGVVSGGSNEACDQFTFVGAGTNDFIGGSDGQLSYNASIAGGISNGITGSAAAFIGGGWLNVISNPPNATYYNSNLSAIGAGNRNTIEAPNSFIGSGYSNTILSPSFAVTNATDSFIGGGFGNTTDANFAVIGGGYTNRTDGELSSVSGGFLNKIGSAATQSFIGAGYNNSINGKDSMILGGANNVVLGDHAFAAGNHSVAPYSGDFVWSDYALPTIGVTATRPNEFMIRASGGFYLYSSTSLSGVKLAPGSGSWSTLSDRNVKSNVQDINPAQILAKLDSMPVSEWSYNSEGSVRHLGPMAQDFRAAFNLGEDDKTISTVDEEGVALASIKALVAENDSKERQISGLRDAHLDDQARLSRLEARLNALEAHTH